MLENKLIGIGCLLSSQCQTSRNIKTHPNWTFWIVNVFPVNKIRQPHEIDFNCIPINLILSPWKCYASEYDWCVEILMRMTCTYTHWFHNEQLNYMLSVAFQSKVLIFANFDTSLSMRFHVMFSFMAFFCFSLLSFLIWKSCSEWLSLHVPTIHSALYDINFAWSGQHERIPVRYEFFCAFANELFSSSTVSWFVLFFALCIHISSSPADTKQVYDPIICLSPRYVQKKILRILACRLCSVKWHWLCGNFPDLNSLSVSRSQKTKNQRQLFSNGLWTVLNYSSTMLWKSVKWC